MKKLMILMLALLVFSSLVAVQLKYWTSEAYIQYIPRIYTAGDHLTRGCTVFTPPSDCDLEGVYFPFYGPAAAGGANVLIEIWPVDVNGLPTGMFPLTSQVVLYADLINWATAPVGEDYNYVDFSAAGLEFGPTGTNGTAFAMVLSSPNGVPGSIYTVTMHDSVSRGNSFQYFVAPTPAGWELWYDFCFTAEVTYSGDLIDVAATSLWFTGDFFMAPGEIINYEADITNNSVDNLGNPIAVAGVDVALALWDAAAMTTPLWTSTTTVNLAASQVLHIDTFADCTLPTTGGRYIVQLQVFHASDANLANNNIYLQQDVPDLTLEDELAYDEGDGNMAHAFYDAGDGWANSFWYYPQPLKVTEVSFEMRDNTWPTGALGNLSYAVYPDDGTGYPDMTNPLVPITQATCTLGAWNTYDVSAYNINIPAGETFYVAYFQVGDYQAGAPGLMGDQTQPISSWATSYAYYYDADLLDYVWETPNATDEDMCIRCTVELGSIEAPIISIALDGGYPTVTWAAVEGALSYNVYGSNDPFAADPWSLLTTGGITGTTFQYTGTAAMQFFKVTAATNLDGTKRMLTPQLVSTKPEIAPMEKSVPRTTYKKNIVTDMVN